MSEQKTRFRYSDYPFEDVVRTANWYISQGCTTYQKFTCAGCGARLTIDVPNIFHKKGKCDSCPRITDIYARGCNLMVVHQGELPGGPP